MRKPARFSFAAIAPFDCPAARAANASRTASPSSGSPTGAAPGPPGTCPKGTGRTVLDVSWIVAAAGIVIGVLNISGLGFGLSLALVDLAGGNTVFLLLISAFICILLGMGMPTVGVYLLLATLIAPSLIEIGVSPMAAHLFILYFGMMSMITPPVAIAAFAAASLTGADAMKTALAATRFGWLAYVIPFLFVASPAYLMQGDVVEILLTVATACAGTWLVCIAIIGHFMRPMGVASRLLFAPAGLALLMPLSGFAGALWFNLAGFVLGSLLIGHEFLARRRARARPPGTIGNKDKHFA